MAVFGHVVQAQIVNDVSELSRKQKLIRNSLIDIHCNCNLPGADEDRIAAGFQQFKVIGVRLIALEAHHVPRTWN